MRSLIVFSDVTLDGFMAGPDNDLEFTVDDPQLTDELMAVADLQIWGRRGVSCRQSDLAEVRR